MRSYNYLFDKYWYRQREFQYIDAIANVEQQQFSNNLTESHLKDLEGTTTAADKQGGDDSANKEEEKKVDNEIDWQGSADNKDASEQARNASNERNHEDGNSQIVEKTSNIKVVMSDS